MARTIKKKKYTFIDGYNVINAWPELKKISAKNLEEARHVLIDYCAEYKAYIGGELHLVFDAYRVDVIGGTSIIEQQGITIVYTDKHQTADSYIEIIVEKLSRDIRSDICVVTSDRVEQQVTFGSGATRMAAREFEMRFKNMRKRIKRKYESSKNQENTLTDHLDKKTIKMLKSWFNK